MKIIVTIIKSKCILYFIVVVIKKKKDIIKFMMENSLKSEISINENNELNDR